MKYWLMLPCVHHSRIIFVNNLNSYAIGCIFGILKKLLVPDKNNVYILHYLYNVKLKENLSVKKELFMTTYIQNGVFFYLFYTLTCIQVHKHYSS